MTVLSNPLIGLLVALSSVTTALWAASTIGAFVVHGLLLRDGAAVQGMLVVAKAAASLALAFAAVACVGILAELLSGGDVLGGIFAFLLVLALAGGGYLYCQLTDSFYKKLRSS